MLIAKAQWTPSTVAGAPRNIGVIASGPVGCFRAFAGKGPPSSSTLSSGNQQFNGLAGGFVGNASLQTAGSGYSVGDVLSDALIQITVDAVDTDGTITDYHVSVVGAYTAYPQNPLVMHGGKGTGAGFNLNMPSPDLYFDITTITAPVAYICAVGGTSGSAQWAQISGSGGGGYMGEYNPNQNYSGGSIVTKSTGNNQGTWAVKPGMMGSLADQPNFPPASASAWVCLALGLQIIGDCGPGGQQNIYVNATAPF